MGNRDPSDPWSDEFHWMRGLFISNEKSGGNGPQLGAATAGDRLLLQARVYNFGFATLPTGSKIHVRYYGMPWDSSSSKPLSSAPSFPIGEQTIDSIPAFDSGSNVPNWVLVGQPFDTTGHEGDLIFWVVVWAEDASGQLIAEANNHGLKAIPPATADFAGVAAVEDSASNNLGFYNQVFHVSAPSSTRVAAASPIGNEVGAQITQVGSESQKIRPGERTLIAARVATASNDLARGLTLYFYDGKPKKNKTIGVQHVPFLGAHGVYDFRVPFRTNVCGAHHIFIVAGKGTRHEHTVKLRPIQVTCPSNEGGKTGNDDPDGDTGDDPTVGPSGN
jgi:hypothetical protein